MQITLFPSRSILTPSGHCSFLDLYKKMSTDEPMLAEADEVAMLASTDKAAYDAKKDSLPCFIVGEFPNRESGAMPSKFEPVLVFDLDHIEDPLSLMDHLKMWPYTWICYPSPSMKGLRLFVKANCDIDTREGVYTRVAGELSLFSNLPLEEAVPKEKRKTVPIINTSTRNIGRFWYYTGIRHFYGNRKAKVWGERPKVTYTPRPAPATIPRASISLDELESLVSEIERRKIDITSDYESWIRAGLGLARDIGEQGRSFFHRISSFHPEYRYGSANSKYNGFLKSVNTSHDKESNLGTLFKVAAESGVVFTFQPSHERQFPEAKFNDRGAETLLNAYLAMNRDNIEEILSRVPSLSEACFRDGANKGVFQAIKFMADKGEFTDPVTVHERVSGFYSDIREDCKEHVTLEAAVGYAELIASLHRKSEATKLLLDMSNRVASGEDVDTVIMSLDTANLAVGVAGQDDSPESSMYESSKRRMELFQRMLRDDAAIPGKTTGIKDHDRFTGGRKEGELGIIAGRPGQGKTVCMMCEATAMAKTGTKVGVVSLEMPRATLRDRQICSEAKISSGKLDNPLSIDFENGEDAKIQLAEDELAKLPIYIVDEEFHWNAIKRRIKRWASMGVKVVYIDYLQLIESDYSHKGQNDVGRIGNITREAKKLTKKHNICIILLSQLNRAVENNGRDRRPNLSHLRESGNIEQDADWVMFTYRPEYYKIMSDMDGFSTVDTCELIYAKHRNGATGSVLVGTRMEHFWFGDLGQRAFAERAKVPRNKPIPGATTELLEEEDDDYTFPELKQGEFDFDNEKDLF